jgi:peptidoglycan/xylan/chitin deacetylase (PgdA/CDA1 family)
VPQDGGAPDPPVVARATRRADPGPAPAPLGDGSDVSVEMETARVERYETSNPRVAYGMMHEQPALPPLGGKRLLVHVAVNIEFWPFDQPLPRAVLPAPHGQQPVPDVANFPWVEYGLRAGMSRLLETLGARGIRASALMNAVCCDVYPQCARAVLDAGWEFVGHGWLQRSLQREADEAAVIAASLERLRAFSGQPVRGWLGPGLGETFATPDVLHAHGVDWVSDWYVDDVPCWLATTRGRMVAMPYTVELNDVPIWAVEKHRSDELHRRVEATLEVFQDELARNPRVLTLALHPHIIGVPHRMAWFRRTLDLLLARDDTAFVTGSELCDWFTAAAG